MQLAIESLYFSPVKSNILDILRVLQAVFLEEKWQVLMIMTSL